MLKRFLWLIVTGAISVTASARVLAQSQSQADPHRAEEVRAKLAGMRAGSRIQVKLMDHSTLKGELGVIAQDHFEVVDAKHRTITPIPYDKVKTVKRASDHSAAYALGFAAAVIAGVLVFTAVLLHGDH